MQTKIKKLTFLKQRYIYLPSFANMEAVTVNAKKLNEITFKPNDGLFHSNSSHKK